MQTECTLLNFDFQLILLNHSAQFGGGDTKKPKANLNIDLVAP